MHLLSPMAKRMSSRPARVLRFQRGGGGDNDAAPFGNLCLSLHLMASMRGKW